MEEEKIHEESTIQDQSIINILLTEQKQIEKEINNYLDAIGKGLVTMSTKRRLEELEARQEELIGKIAIEESKAKICLSKDEVEQYIKKALSNNAKSMIDMLVKKIIVYDDKLEIELNYTDRNSPDDEHRGFAICSMQTTMKKHIGYNNISIDVPCQIEFLV